MKTRALIMLGLAVALAAVSVVLAQNWIQSQIKPVAQVEEKPQVETTRVVVAAAPLKYGSKIRREHLMVVDWPATSVPEGAFTNINAILGDPEEQKKTGKPVEDRVVVRSIEKNEPVLKTKVTGFGGRASLSALISPGMRATTIRVNDVNGVAGFVLPGDRVDIMLTRDPSGSGRRGGSGLVTDVLLQNMKVLGIDQDANEDRSKPAVVKAVTLEVTTTQAQKLTLAQKLGTLSLALRHVNTVDAEAPQSVSARDLRIGEANLAPDPKAGKGKGKAADGGTTQVVEKMAPRTQKKAIVTKAVATTKEKNVSSVRIVRGLTAKEYEVTPEKPTFSAPAYSKPLNLLPSKLAPTGGPVPPASAPMPLAPSPLAPMPDKSGPGAGEPAEATAAGEKETSSERERKLLPTTEPISLLKRGGAPGDDS